MDRNGFIVFDKVSKLYPMGEITVTALKDVDLSIPQGAFVVILGPSGSGKTTLLNLAGGLDEVTSGTIKVGERMITSYPRSLLNEYRRLAIGFVFQFFNLIPTLTAEENVAFAVELAGNREGARESSRQALAAVGLAERAGHFPGQLSGGEQQRVAIARAVSKNPPVLLCDEPTGELDYASAVMVLGLLRRINRQAGKTVLLVTHNAAVAGMADLVVHMHSGEIADMVEVPSPLEAADIRW
jgi:putative ABC transport system ATP-binding protein